MALAPSLLFVGVPSSSSILLSIARWLNTLSPMSAGAIILLTFSTALRVPLPRYLFLSPSRSSSASFSPVLAPEGTAARPKTPFSRTTSTSTVGLPRESRISRPTIFLIVISLKLKITRYKDIFLSNTKQYPK